MKKTLSIIALSLISMSSAFAACDGANCSQIGNQNGAGNLSGAASQSQGQWNQSGAQAANQGNAQTINNNGAPGVAYSGKYDVSSVPTAIAPALTTTLTETCMGSTTGGVAVLGLGLSGGTTWKDEECVRRLNARELAQTLHELDAAKELLCGNQEINAVYQSLGRPCLMKASGTGLIPGGALINYRTPVEPKPRPVSQVERQVAPVVVQQVPIAHEEVTDEQDLQGQQAQQTLKNADVARAAMKTKYGW